jgi:hypothetical protein
MHRSTVVAPAKKAFYEAHKQHMEHSQNEYAYPEPAVDEIEVQSDKSDTKHAM